MTSKDCVVGSAPSSEPKDEIKESDTPSDLNEKIVRVIRVGGTKTACGDCAYEMHLHNDESLKEAFDKKAKKTRLVHEDYHASDVGGRKAVTMTPNFGIPFSGWKFKNEARPKGEYGSDELACDEYQEQDYNELYDIFNSVIKESEKSEQHMQITSSILDAWDHRKDDIKGVFDAIDFLQAEEGKEEKRPKKEDDVNLMLKVWGEYDNLKNGLSFFSNLGFDESLSCKKLIEVHLRKIYNKINVDDSDAADCHESLNIPAISFDPINVLVEKVNGISGLNEGWRNAVKGLVLYERFAIKQLDLNIQKAFAIKEYAHLGDEAFNVDELPLWDKMNEILLDTLVLCRNILEEKKITKGLINRAWIPCVEKIKKKLISFSDICTNLKVSTFNEEYTYINEIASLNAIAGLDAKTFNENSLKTYESNILNYIKGKKDEYFKRRLAVWAKYPEQTPKTPVADLKEEKK